MGATHNAVTQISSLYRRNGKHLIKAFRLQKHLIKKQWRKFLNRNKRHSSAIIWGSGLAPLKLPNLFSSYRFFFSSLNYPQINHLHIAQPSDFTQLVCVSWTTYIFWPQFETRHFKCFGIVWAWKWVGTYAEKWYFSYKYAKASASSASAVRIVTKHRKYHLQRNCFLTFMGC